MFSQIDIYKLLDSLHIPFEEIESATNDFADENLLKQGVSFKVYNGKLVQPEGLIDIVARKCMQRSIVYNELAISKNLKHENIVSTYGFTLSMNEDIIINKKQANQSLDKHLSDPTLTWMQRLHICVVVAQTLKYLHHDAKDNHNIIHGNVKSSKVLLDENWEPKLHGFAFAGIAPKDKLLHCTSHQMPMSSPYMDPAYESTKGLSHKSDVFSFGIVMFEVLFGREASIQDNNNGYFARLAITHYKEGKLDKLINPDIRTQMSLQSSSIFAEAAWCCLKEQPSQRPDMKQVLSRLEYVLELQQKYETSRAAGDASQSNHNHLKERSLDHLRFRLWDLNLATSNFSDTFCIGSGGYAKVYKAELHFDSTNLLSVEGNNKSRLPKRHITVAIKRITSRVDMQGEQGFFSEIEMLSKCRHPNIVSLLGFCNEEHEMILVYEYVSNGSLETYLENTDKMKDFTWTRRLKICLDIANGLNYLHTSIKDKPCIIHRDIKSANILLDDKWVAKIADFGFSRLHVFENRSTLAISTIAGTQGYLDPEYENSGRLKTKSDVYSFGVVLLEIMCGKSVYDRTFQENGLPSLAREYFNEGTLEKLVDLKIERIDTLFNRFDQYSFDAFSNIAYECVEKMQSQRPTMDVVVKKLEEALNFQNKKGRFHISFDAIKTGTQNFSDDNCIKKGRFWKLYKGEIAHANGYCAIVAKVWDSTKPHRGEDDFRKELVLLSKHNHENIIGLVGYCYEMNEKIIVYEHAINGRLDKHVYDHSLTWMTRLKICIDIAKGLEFLHTGSDGQEDEMIHRDIRSGSILLDGDWNAKICNLERSCKTLTYDRAKHIDEYGDNDYASLGYVDPQYLLCGYLSKQSDIYSLGVILMEMLCGILSKAKGWEDHSESLGPRASRHYNRKKNFDEMIFDGIKKQIEPESLAKFQMIASQCLAGEWVERPEASDVVIQLKEALEFQKNSERNFHISLETIELWTHNFSDENLIRRIDYSWALYEGQARHAMKFIVKRSDDLIDYRQWEVFDEGLFFEIELLLKCKHENILGLVGYNNENGKRIMVYEHVSSNRGLQNHVMDPLLTWMERLKICIGVAKGLEFLQKFETKKYKIRLRDWMIHIDFNISNIAVDDDWNVKICTFKVSNSPDDEHRWGYNKKRMTSSISSLGVILFEMLCGRLSHVYEDPSRRLDVPLLDDVRHYNKRGNLDKMVFENIKEQIAAKSLTTFVAIALKCLEDKASYHSESHERNVVTQLEKALEFQLLHDQTYHQQPNQQPSDDSNLTKSRNENEISKGVIGKWKDKRKIEQYRSTLEKKYSRIIADKKDFECSLKEALDLFPDNENLIEWKQKIEELFGREVEVPSPRSQSGCTIT